MNRHTTSNLADELAIHPLGVASSHLRRTTNNVRGKWLIILAYAFFVSESVVSGILSGRINVRPNRVWQNNSRYACEYTRDKNIREAKIINQMQQFDGNQYTLFVVVVRRRCDDCTRRVNLGRPAAWLISRQKVNLVIKMIDKPEKVPIIEGQNRGKIFGRRLLKRRRVKARENRGVRSGGLKFGEIRESEIRLESPIMSGVTQIATAR